MKHEFPSVDDIIEVCEATWPPAAIKQLGAWTIRDGAGGGNRVSAATENWPTTEADLPVAEKAMRAQGMDPLFQIRHDNEHLGEMLEQHGYHIIDPVNIWVIEVGELTREKLPPVAAFSIWPMLSIMHELWQAGGIEQARRDVMERADCPKTGLLARTDDKPSGVGFVGLHKNIAMVHAMHVDERLRRQGTGRNLLKQAAHWAEQQGAKYLSLIVTQGNKAANPLYADLGMQLVGHYHYRTKST